jgi:hypothetical protein
VGDSRSRPREEGEGCSPYCWSLLRSISVWRDWMGFRVRGEEE